MFHRMMKGLHPNGWRCSIDSFIRCGQEPGGHTTQGDPSDADALLLNWLGILIRSPQIYHSPIVPSNVGKKYHKYKDIERFFYSNKYNDNYCSLFTTPNVPTHPIKKKKKHTGSQPWAKGPVTHQA